ncbi:MAG TPA: DUF6457 domain-containing protein [Actinomycetota bacterium]|nr:DUF6457 domain-containing protein [Actinomycetota bacterium]
MSELERWFGPLDESLGIGADQPPVGPGPEEVTVLLEIGKLAAEAGPQRLYALLTAFAVGRALGRAEVRDPAVDVLGFVEAALSRVQALAANADRHP